MCQIISTDLFKINTDPNIWEIIKSIANNMLADRNS